MAVADCCLLEYGAKERGLSGPINCVGVGCRPCCLFLLSVLVQIHFVRSFSFSQVLGWLLGVISLHGSHSIKIDFFTVNNIALIIMH